MNLYVNLVQSIQLKLFRSSKEYKKRNLPLDMADVLTRASRILVCLPADPTTVGTACKIIDKISSDFPKWSITVIVNEKYNSSTLNKEKYTLISYSDEDVAKSEKPKKLLVARVFQNTFDVAIDMSIPYSFTNLIFTWLSGAKLRVGFHHEERETLYNFLVRHKADATVEYSYLSLVNYLRSFH